MQHIVNIHSFCLHALEDAAIIHTCVPKNLRRQRPAALAEAVSAG